MTINHRTTMRLATMMAALIVLGFGVQAQAQVKDPHSSRGCAACHTPHNSFEDTSVPLWTKIDPATSFLAPTNDRTAASELADQTTYDSSGMDATEAGQNITGASVLCLSCHDGTSGGDARAFGATKGLGALSHSHPMGITYDAALVAADPELKDPTTLPVGVLDNASKVGCQSCHDVHVQRETATSAGAKYLRWAYKDDYIRASGGVPASGDRRSDDFCNNCHIK